MSFNQAAFEQFRESVKSLAEIARPTEVTDSERVKRAKGVFLNRIDVNMAFELESCLHCGMCAESCHFYVQTRNAKYTPIHKLDLMRRVYRRELSPHRWLYRLFTKDITARELEAWQELVYDSCTECGRCALMCPMGINIPKMVHISREALAEAGLTPVELWAVGQEQCNNGTIFGVGPEQLKDAVEKLKEGGIDISLDKEKADVLVLTTVVDILLFNDALTATARIMNHLALDWTIHSRGFEAANFGLLSGNEQLQRAASMRIIDAAIACGAKTVIVPECGHAYPALRWEGANHYGKPLPFEVMAISEFMGREVRAGKLKLKQIGMRKKAVFHDPCKVARHGGSTEEPREVLNALGIDARETASNREMNWCCGGGAGVFVINRATHLRQKAFEKKMEQVDDTGADSVITACGSCRLNFLSGAANAHWNKRIESLVEIVGENLAE